MLHLDTSLAQRQTTLSPTGPAVRGTTKTTTNLPSKREEFDHRPSGNSALPTLSDEGP
jgi:hypothetical protein